MIHPLASCVAKLNRAELHAETFDAQARGTKSRFDNRVELNAKGAPSPMWFRWKVGVDWEFPPEVSTGLGDAIHNLRSALDHLVWGLTVQSKRKVGRWTHFPIRSDPAWRKNDAVKKTLANLAPAQVKIIDSLQPYHQRQPSTHPLALLARLDDDDKHQALYVFQLMPRNVSFEAVAIKHCDILEIAPNIGVHLDSQTEIGTVKVNLTGPKPQIHVTSEFVPEIGFPDGVLVLTRFQELQMFVFEEVLPPLAPDLILDYPVARLPE